jgi:hypothetical protein
MRWSVTKYIYLAPTFNPDLLAQAKTACRINVTNTQTWIPVEAIFPIS